MAVGKGNIFNFIAEWIKKEEENRKNKKVSINSIMSELTLTDVTQVLLKQNQELTVNTAETKDTKAGIAELSKVLGDYFKNQQRLDEGDRLEIKEKKKMLKEPVVKVYFLMRLKVLDLFGLPKFLGAIRGLFTGLILVQH